MSSIYSLNKSGKDNPYVKILSAEYLINADGQEVKRTVPRPTRPAIIRFLEKIIVSETRFYNGTPCWEWQGCKSKTTGYGQFKIDGRRGSKLSSPHVFSHLYFIGEIPEGKEPDHECENRGCGSPFHLTAVTHKENCQRRSAKLTHCKNNHEFTPENTAIGKRGERRCRACNRDRVKAFYGRKLENILNTDK